MTDESLERISSSILNPLAPTTTIGISKIKPYNHQAIKRVKLQKATLIFQPRVLRAVNYTRALVGTNIVEPNNSSHARSEPINPIYVSHVEVINKAHSEGSSIGPMEVMEEDQFILENTTAHGVVNSSPRRTN